MVRELEARRAGVGVDVEGGDLERRLGERERLHLGEVGGEDEERSAREEVGEHADGERRALDRVGAGAGLVQQHQRRRAVTVRAIAARLAGVRGEGGEVALDRLLVADVGETASKQRQARAVGGGDEEPGLRHQRRRARAS